MSFIRRGGLFLTWTAAVLLLLSGNSFGQEDTAKTAISIIANPSVSVTAIDKDTLKKIFTGQLVVWGDGRPIKTALLAEGEAHTRFVGGFLGKTPSQFQTYWRKMVFTGQGVQPPTFDSEQKMIDYVAGTEGAIGYISSSTGAANTKTLPVPEK
jgi:ABC-type phosphate transport system substrate-binding protein